MIDEAKPGARPVIAHGTHDNRDLRRPLAIVRDGADSLLIRDDRIRIMTVHYTVEGVA
ncbi:MAG TPA: hypothetical protein VNE58_13835 [Casimicrobiaceae bacterium]|nr:hypothetical protein [Casimicrobiaceae bacterium]